MRLLIEWLESFDNIKCINSQFIILGMKWLEEGEKEGLVLAAIKSCQQARLVKMNALYIGIRNAAPVFIV